MIVIAFLHFQFCAGADAAVLEEFKETAVAFVDSADSVARVELGIREKDEASSATAGGAFHFAEIAVGAGASGS